jgi:orotate phosphoribosyltransferase
MADFAEQLISFYRMRKAYGFGDFAMTGGGRTDFYIDGRLVTTYPPALQVIGDAIATLVRTEVLCPPGTTLVAPAVSGIPVGVVTALALNIPYVIDRGRAKQHGAGRRFEGHFDSGDRCLIVDDLTTVGSTLVNTVGALRELGKTVTDAIVVVDREEGAANALGSLGVRLHRIITGEDLRRVARHDDTLSPEGATW